MIRERSLVRRLVVFGGVACVALGFLLARPARTTPPPTTFPALFPGFDPAAAATVRLAKTTKRDGKETRHDVVLERTGASAWVVANRQSHPAKAPQVGRFLDEVRDAKEKVENTRDPSRARSFAGEDGFTEVTIEGTDKAVLARFGLGKSAPGGSWEDSFVRVGEPPAEGVAGPVGVAPATSKDFRVVTAQGLDSYLRAEPEEWVERDLWPALSGSDLVGLEIEQVEKGRTIALVREEKKPTEPPPTGAEAPTPPKAEDAWRIEKPTPGPASPSAASATASAFAGLSLESIVSPRDGATEADYGFDRPSLVITGRGRLLAGAREAPAYVLRVGKKVEGKDASYVRRGVEPFVFEVSQGALKEFQGEPDAWAEKKPEEKKPDEKPGEAKPGDAPPGGTKPDEKPTGEAKPEDGAVPPKEEGTKPEGDGTTTPPGETPPPPPKEGDGAPPAPGGADGSGAGPK